jgi:aldehyde:ferredoxin oxidoreductase
MAPVTDLMKDRFIGGKGFDLWLLWQAITGDTRWNDPENAICIASGPMGGTPSYPGSGKSIVTTISPLTQMVIDSNVGGYFGPYLKFSGFDALQITGKTAEKTIIYIDGIEGKIELLAADGLPDGKYFRGLYRARRPAYVIRLPQFFLVRCQAQASPL